MDRTVSRRSEPSSRAAFMGEQPNPWDVLPPQDAMSRHRLYFKYILYFKPKAINYAKGHKLKFIMKNFKYKGFY